MPDNLEREVGTILAKLDALDKKIDSLWIDQRDREQRLRSLEDFKARVYGAGFAVSIGWTVITWALVNYTH